MESRSGTQQENYMSEMNAFSGRRFDPIKMTSDDVCLTDIAHALSLLCRGGGHLRYFYSVAQHCINCAREAEARGYDRRLQLACLLHDGSEAYISDIIRPVKIYLSNYLEIESAIMEKVWEHFGLDDLSKEEHRLWKAIDDDILFYEQHYLMTGKEDVVLPKLSSTPDLCEKDFSQVEKEFIERASRLLPV